MRKYLRAFLCFALAVVLFLVTVAVQGAEEESRRLYYNDDYIYEVNEDSTVSILYYVGESVTVTVPAYIDNKPVVLVEDLAFYDTQVKTVIISEGVRSLGDEVFFNCTKLKAVSLPSTLERVGTGVFRACENLESVYFASSKGVLGMYMFYGCTSLNSVSLPEEIKEIPKGVFSYCKSLTNIYLPEGVETIGDYAFYRSGLVRIEFPSSLHNIRTMAFAGSADLAEVVIGNAVSYYIAEDAFEGCATTLPGGSADPTEPSDPNTPALPPPWEGDNQNPTEDSWECTIDELPTEAPTSGPTDAPAVSPQGGGITKEGYCIGGYEEMLNHEVTVSLITNTQVKNNKKELLEIAYNVRTAGDANKDGQVNIKDATKIQCFCAGLASEDDPDFSYKNSDVNTDGRVNVKDATKIQKFVAGLVASLL